MDKKKILKVLLVGLVDAAILTAIGYAAYKSSFYAKKLIEDLKKKKEEQNNSEQK